MAPSREAKWIPSVMNKLSAKTKKLVYPLTPETSSLKFEPVVTGKPTMWNGKNLLLSRSDNVKC